MRKLPILFILLASMTCGAQVQIRNGVQIGSTSGITSINSQTGPAITVQSTGGTVAVTEPSANVLNLEATIGNSFSQYVVPPIDSQHAIVYASVVTTSGLPGCTTNSLEAGDSYAYGSRGPVAGICSAGLYADWSAYDVNLPSWINPANITAIYPFGVSSTTGGIFFLDCSYNGALTEQLESSTNNIGYVVGSGAGWGTDLSKVTCEYVNSGSSDPLTRVSNAYEIGLFVYDSVDTAPVQSSIYTKPPLYYDALSSSLGINLPTDVGADTGAVNAYVVNITGYPEAAYIPGETINFVPVASNTSTTPTLNFNGGGALTVTDPAGNALLAGDMSSTRVATVKYEPDNTFSLQNPQVSGGSSTYALTMNNGGSGDASGTSFNGTVARTLSYNTLGATGISGTPTIGNCAQWASVNTLSDIPCGAGSGAIILPHGTASGSMSGAMTLTTAPVVSSLTVGTEVMFIGSSTGTPGASTTLNVGGTGAIGVKKSGGISLRGADLSSTAYNLVVYDGTYWVLQIPIQPSATVYTDATNSTIAFTDSSTLGVNSTVMGFTASSGANSVAIGRSATADVSDVVAGYLAKGGGSDVNIGSQAAGFGSNGNNVCVGILACYYMDSSGGLGNHNTMYGANAGSYNTSYGYTYSGAFGSGSGPSANNVTNQWLWGTGIGSAKSNYQQLGNTSITDTQINGIVEQTLGTVIASATTIAPTTRFFHVSGTAAITTITAPSACTTTGYACQITAIPDGAFTTVTGGNIALASTAVVNRALTWIYDPGTSLWYPSY